MGGGASGKKWRGAISRKMWQSAFMPPTCAVDGEEVVCERKIM